MQPRHKRLWVLGLALFAVAMVGWLILGQFEVRAWMDRVLVAVRKAGPVVFFAAMAVLPTIGFPLSAFTLVAGPVYAPTLGLPVVILCGLAAIICNVALSYWLAARAMRPLAQRVVQRFGYGLPDIEPGAAWMTIMVVRSVPVTPFWLQGILLGLARVPFGPYMLVSTVVPSIYAVALIVLTDAFMRGDRWAIGAAVGLFLAVGTVLHVMRKRLRGSGLSTRTPTETRH
jgi:uncharacterized membrane protein YdjX (TVP38/TMEM64 family)